MSVRILGRLLHLIYPVLVFTFAIAAWSSSNPPEPSLMPPPLGDGLGFAWSPSLALKNHAQNRTN